jgi:transposase
VTMTLGTQRPDTKIEVILGVDTHTPGLPHGGGRGQSSGQTPGRVERTNDRKGLREAPLCWAEGFGPVRCAGIEGTSSYGALSSPAT